MKGNVIGFDSDTNTGAISGHDGRRYDFATVDWHSSRRPVHGDLVDFAPDNQRATQIYLLEAEYVRPSFAQFYFSPHGRISRSQYWLRWMLPITIIAFVLIILIQATKDSDAGLVFSIIYVLFLLITFWPSLALMIKRVHDRDWPWAFILVMFVPLVQFWPLIEMLFLRGTVGSNRFGPDPVVTAAR